MIHVTKQTKDKGVKYEKNSKKYSWNVKAG